MRSMTGFGSAVGENGSHRVAVTLRGVNHRYLDVVVRLPDVCRGSEAALKRLLGESLSRGRLELAVEVERTAAGAARLDLGTEVARAVVMAVDELRAAGLVEGDLSPGELLQVPGVVDVGAAADEWTEADEALLHQVVSEALAELAEARRAEGARLARVVADKLEQIEAGVAELEALRPEAQQALAESFESRLEELLEDGELEPRRLEQEVAVLIDRSNVSEELERLRAHVEHFAEILEQADGAVGKRLDFVVQEIFRELNTLSAKCRSAAMTRLVVEAKVVCEELREQLRNVE